MQKTVAFDLETIADRSIIPFLPEVKAKGSLRDPVKIEADIKDKKEKQIAEMGLDPKHNMICCFSWCDGGRSGSLLLSEESHEGERELIVAAWELLHRYDHFVTFNGNQFDVPVINLHSLFRRVRPAVNISTRRYVIENHTDLRAVLGGWDPYAKGNMDFYMKRLFGADSGKPSDIDGSLVQHYWDVGMHEEVGGYGTKDAVDTWKFYEVAKKYHPLVN